MSGEMILFLVLGACAGGFINGLAGTGTALFALAFYLVVLEPITAVAVVALLSVASGFQGLWVVRGEILNQPYRLLRFLIPGLLGVPVGLWLLGYINATALRLSVAGFLIVYGGYFSFRAVLPSFSRRTPWLDGLVGAIGGVLGGAASLAGAVPAMWMSLRPWRKSETRSVLQPYNFSILTLTVVLLAFRGAYDAVAVKALLITIPCGLIAAQVGIMVFHRLSDLMFRRALIVLTFLMGIGVLVSELF